MFVSELCFFVLCVFLYFYPISKCSFHVIFVSIVSTLHLSYPKLQCVHQPIQATESLFSLVLPFFNFLAQFSFIWFHRIDTRFFFHQSPRGAELWFVSLGSFVVCVLQLFTNHWLVKQWICTQLFKACSVYRKYCYIRIPSRLLASLCFSA